MPLDLSGLKSCSWLSGPLVSPALPFSEQLLTSSPVYQATVGAVAWPIAAEAATSRLRAPTQALATMMNGLSSCIWSFSLPYAINPDQGNLGGKIAFIFGSVVCACTVFVFFMIPETKGRTYIEIDELWARKTPARKFKQTSLVTLSDEGGKGDE